MRQTGIQSERSEERRKIERGGVGGGGGRGRQGKADMICVRVWRRAM